MAVKILDLGNGSYSGVTTLMWPGVTLTQVSLTFPREFLREAVVARHTLHSLRWVLGMFERNHTKEVFFLKDKEEAFGERRHLHVCDL